MNEQQKDLLDQQMKLRRGAAIIAGTQEQFRQDGYTNLLNKYGTKQDSSTSYTYSQETITSDMELIRIYEGNGLFAKIIDRPAEEAVKHGLDIDFGDEDISEYVDNILDKLEYEDKFATAEKWARLYGGSIIVMLVDDGLGLEEPLNWEKATKIEELQVFERSIVQPEYCFSNSFFSDVLNTKCKLGEPEYYQVSSIYGYFKVHRSRCLVFRNGKLPEQTTDANYRYWGMPEYIRLKRALRECVTSHGNGVKLLERSAQAIYKMKGLANLLTTSDGEDKVLQRLQVIDMARGILNSIAIDNDGEDYNYESLQMSGVKDVIDATCNMLSAVTNIPQTILFGRSPSGMNSTGESDLENYYNMVENIQKQNMKANARTVIDLILKQGLVEGEITDIPKYKMKFAALWSISDNEKADIENKKAQTEYVKAQTTQIYIDAGVVDPSEVRKSLAKEGNIEIEEILTETGLELPEDMFDFELPTISSQVSGIKEQVSTDGLDFLAAAVIIIKDGKVLCASRANGEGICGAGGKAEAGETTELTAIREAQEEFNITPHNLIPLGEYKATTGKYLNTKVYFTDEYTGTPKVDGKEMQNEQWLTLEELQKKQLFPPFEESLRMLQIFLKNYLTNSSFTDSLTLEEFDGGPGL